MIRMADITTSIDSISTLPLWADIVIIFLGIVLLFVVAKALIEVGSFLFGALIGFLMLIVGGVFLFVASLIERMDD